jgi:hypothetical protein
MKCLAFHGDQSNLKPADAETVNIEGHGRFTRVGQHGTMK